MLSTQPIEDTTNASFRLSGQTCQRLTLAQIKSATNNFDKALVIGRGGFGKVYKSLNMFGLESEVAIKRLHSTSNQGANEFEAEVKLLSKLRHGNLVSLIGYCNEGNEMIIAYEFMPNGTLGDHLHKGFSKLSWLQRLKICTGAARGLDYLHTGTSTQHGVIHRDVKSTNILLDSNFAAKIADFGLAKVGTINQTRTHVSTIVKGTFGYLDPCYVYSGRLTRKSDVYSFGVVLLEVLSGKKAVDRTLDEDQWSLAVWAQEKIKGGRVQEIVESELMGQISKKCLKEYTNIAVLCLHNQPKERPTMAEVVVKLDSIMSRERKNVGSGVDDGKFINKVRYLFRGKAELMPPHAEENTSEIIAEEIQKSEFEPLDLKSDEYNHPNLVKYLGYYLNEENVSCFYNLIPGASLDELLYGDQVTTSLSWVARLKIAVGAAQGLSFLHKRGYPGYTQFKTTCILVDTDYNARLWNFEVNDSFLSRDSYLFRVNSHYAAPEWFHYQADVRLEATNIRVLKLKRKGDNIVYPWKDAVEPSESYSLGIENEIYSFGVVLLEILTGKKVYERNRPKEKQNLVTWATPLLTHETNLEMILDTQLLDDNKSPKGAYKLTLLVSNCLQPTHDKRPSMEEIVLVLSECYLEQFDS